MMMMAVVTAPPTGHCQQQHSVEEINECKRNNYPTVLFFQCLISSSSPSSTTLLSSAQIGI
ncbi:hypothetical protein TYRP_005501 [Tyrophagus putrescentiae]|nr:hypothetical protein TYRP_005501 [Tyrophagus putrescentiae]